MLHLYNTRLYGGTAIKNQTEYTEDSGLCGGNPPCDVRFYPVFYTIRGIEMWWGGGMIYINAPYPSDSCPLVLL